jgi:dephospho-CoA kinase
MEPGQAVYAAIVAHFGKGVVMADGRLDRAALAKIAFADGRVEELNAIVHPAAIARQEELMETIFRREPRSIVIVESALLFETKYGGGSNVAGRKRWQNRFDKVILVTAPEVVKVARFVGRSAEGGAIPTERREELEAEALRRLAQQIPDEQKSAQCDYVLTNGGALSELEWQVDQLWPILQAAARKLLTGRQ